MFLLSNDNTFLSSIIHVDNEEQIGIMAGCGIGFGARLLETLVSQQEPSLAAHPLLSGT